MDSDTTLSVTIMENRSICVVAVCQSKGIGSVFEASEGGVQCLLGTRGTGTHEAFARSLLELCGCKQVILTISCAALTPVMAKVLLGAIKERVVSIS